MIILLNSALPQAQAAPSQKKDAEEQIDPNVSIPFVHVQFLTTFNGSFLQLSQQYFKLRTQAIQAQKVSGPHPYPHKFQVTLSLIDFIDSYQHLEPGQHHTDVVSVAGKLHCPSCMHNCEFQSAYTNMGRSVNQLQYILLT